MSTSARCVILTTRRSSINSVTPTTSAMGLDVLSLNSGHSNRVHDSGSTTSSKRVRERKQRASKPSMRGVSISTRSLASKESKRRRRRRPKKIEDHHQRESSACGNDADEEDQQEVLSFHKRWDRTSNFEDPLDSGKTEHTSNLTEHSRTIRQGLDDDITYNKVEDESNSSDNEEVVSLGGSERSSEQTVETRESRFQSLLNQWKTREKEQKEITQATAPDTKSKANYLSEDEDHSCFEGVLKHWRKRDGRSTTVESYQPEVVVDDETSEVSSLGDSLRDGMRWGYESDSRFDFGFDARFDTAIPASPRSAKKKKKKSSRKKEESRSPKSSKKKNSDSKSKKKKIKSSDASFATFDAAMNAAEAAMDESVTTMDTTDSKKKKKKKSKSKKYGAAMDAAEAAMDGSVATIDESVATMDTTDSKKKKKKSKSKKKVKSKKSSKKSLVGNENSESTETEVPPLSDDEGSKGAYLPGWLSPAQPSPIKRKSKVDSPKKNDPPAEMPELPNLL